LLCLAWLAATPPSAGEETARDAEVLDLVNRERRAAGLSNLSRDAALAEAAQAHADDLARRGALSHTGGDGSTVADRVWRAGYRFRRLAENVAVGQESPREVVAGWMDSPGHRENILRPGLADIGVGYAEGAAYADAPGRYWVIVLARPLP
jgi:uncharacterized protein YkwD